MELIKKIMSGGVKDMANTKRPSSSVTARLDFDRFLLNFSFFTGSFLIMYVPHKSFTIDADAKIKREDTVDITAAIGAARNNPAAPTGMIC